MTQAVELPSQGLRSAENKVVLGVCFAHFVSHYYILLLAPLFVIIKDDYGVSYTELGLAFTFFNTVSMVVQTPTGFLVDRVSARLVLIAGLLIGATAFAVAGLVHSYWVFVAMFALAGLGNTVYHPADYALLSQHVPPQRVGRVFSYHTFAGMMGNAAAPFTLVYLNNLIGWRGAFLCAAALGVVAAVMLALQGEPAVAAPRPAKPRGAEAAAEAAPSGWRLLLSAPILANLIFFVLLSLSGGSLNNYLVATLGAAYGTPPDVANAGLTGLLAMSGVGVLVGGVLAGRTSSHGLVVSCGLIATAGVCVLLGLVDLPVMLLVLATSAAGFFTGLTMPSRDMIVRMVTPAGAYGRVFGFVSTGFNIAGMISPLIFGQLLDRGYTREVFFVMAGCALVAITTIMIGTTRRPAAA